MAKNIKLAFQQAPWRIHLQRVFFVLALLASIVIIAILHLFVSAQTYTTYVEINRFEARRRELINEIADLKTKKAMITSALAMEQRAEAMNFRKMDSDQVYLTVAGYSGRQFEFQAPPPREIDFPASVNPSYTQSIWEWLFIDKQDRFNGG